MHSAETTTANASLMRLRTGDGYLSLVEGVGAIRRSEDDVDPDELFVAVVVRDAPGHER
jgi:hypothetical protein